MDQRIAHLLSRQKVTALGARSAKRPSSRGMGTNKHESSTCSPVPGRSSLPTRAGSPCGIRVMPIGFWRESPRGFGVRCSGSHLERKRRRQELAYADGLLSRVQIASNNLLASKPAAEILECFHAVPYSPTAQEETRESTLCRFIRARKRSKAEGAARAAEADPRTDMPMREKTGCPPLTRSTVQ